MFGIKYFNVRQINTWLARKIFQAHRQQITL